MNTASEGDVKPLDQRSMHRKIRLLIPASFFRALTLFYNMVASRIPFSLKYNFGLMLRRGRYPYSVIEKGDVVIQVGAPRDILRAGRSRSIFFGLLAGAEGKVLVVEADPENCAAFRAYTEKHGIADRFALVNSGAWEYETELAFLSNPDHPASNVLVDASKTPAEELEKRGYDMIRIPVNSLDNLLAAAGISATPKMASVTPNGGEIEIIKGLQNARDNGLSYISTSATNPEFAAFAKGIGFHHAAVDDRGYFFIKDS